jgi:hypothetical protein
MDERLLDPGVEDDEPIDVGALTGPEETGNADSEEYVVCGGPCNGETAATKLGKLMHIGLEAELGSDYDYNVYLGPGVGYADAVNFETNTIVELKPAGAERLGMQQLRRYQAALQNETGEVWHIELRTYNRWNGPH